VAAAGLIGAAGVHLPLSDYGRNIDLAAAQALNALDADSFVLFTAGLSALVLAGSLIALRSHLLSPCLGCAWIIVAIALFTSVGFFGSCTDGPWIIATSIILYLRAQPSGMSRTGTTVRATPLAPAGRGSTGGGDGGRHVIAHRPRAPAGYGARGAPALSGQGTAPPLP
jgi:hypothetical protein